MLRVSPVGAAYRSEVGNGSVITIDATADMNEAGIMSIEAPYRIATIMQVMKNVIPMAKKSPEQITGHN